MNVLLEKRGGEENRIKLNENSSCFFQYENDVKMKK